MNRRSLLKTLLLAPLAKLLPKSKVAAKSVKRMAIDGIWYDEEPKKLTWTVTGSDSNSTISYCIYTIDGQGVCKSEGKYFLIPSLRDADEPDIYTFNDGEPI